MDAVLSSPELKQVGWIISCLLLPAFIWVIIQWRKDATELNNLTKLVLTAVEQNTAAWNATKDVLDLKGTVEGLKNDIARIGPPRS